MAGESIFYMTTSFHWELAHKTSLTTPLFTEVPVSSQESELYIFVLGVSSLPLFLWLFD